MARIETVTSAANPLLKEVRRAASRGTATKEGLWIAEGIHLFEEALRSECGIPVVLTAESVASRFERHVPERMVTVSDPLFAELTTTQTPQGIISLVRAPEWRMDQLFHRESPVIVLDGVQDPGNAGAIARAAEAFGASGIVFGRGSVSPGNPKTLRAAAGSLFRLPFVSGIDARLIHEVLRQHRRTTYAAMPINPATIFLEDAALERNCAFIIGSEGQGVSAEFLAEAQGLSIPTTSVESLNAAMAATVLLYEAQRQRVTKAMLA